MTQNSLYFSAMQLQNLFYFLKKLPKFGILSFSKHFNILLHLKSTWCACARINHRTHRVAVSLFGQGPFFLRWLYLNTRSSRCPTMTAVHLIVTSLQVLSPPTPGPPVSVFLCCFKICMSLRNASHGSKLCVSQPPTWWNDPFKAGSICLNLHSSSLSKASGFGTERRNMWIKAHDRVFLRAGKRRGWIKPRPVNDGWMKMYDRKKSKTRNLTLFPVCVCVCVPFAQCSCVFLGVKRIKPGGSERERETEVWEKGEEGYIRKKWERTCVHVCVRACVCVCVVVITRKLINTWHRTWKSAIFLEWRRCTVSVLVKGLYVSGGV